MASISYNNNRNCPQNIKKGKGKCAPVLDWTPQQEDIWGSGGVAPHIRDLGTTWQ